ncbi:MAG: preprotein translocase subunit YajC [Planctomycetes bacterium]|nr:preprotein translocase subunit YajC [Planctomycetota bacterium]
MNVIVNSLAQTGGVDGGIFGMIIPFGLMFVLLYFLIIRPQKKKEQARLQMLSNVKKNDRVMTSGGIYGIISAIKDKEVVLKIDEKNDIKIRVLKSAIIGIEKSTENNSEKQ